MKDNNSTIYDLMAYTCELNILIDDKEASNVSIEELIDAEKYSYSRFPAAKTLKFAQ